MSLRRRKPGGTQRLSSTLTWIASRTLAIPTPPIDQNDDALDVPPHVEETLRAIERLHAEHHAAATGLERGVDRLNAVVGQPQTLIVLALATLLWVGVNLALAGSGDRPFDPPPFNGLQAVMTPLALGVTVLILASQRRADRLAARRERLTLELAILAERKTAKVIALLEEMRRDHPELVDRVDEQADAMAAPSDPEAMLEAARRREAEGEVGAADQPVAPDIG